MDLIGVADALKLQDEVQLDGEARAAVVRGEQQLGAALRADVDSFERGRPSIPAPDPSLIRLDADHLIIARTSAPAGNGPASPNGRIYQRGCSIRQGMS
jgi:hypothetical protein